MQRPYLIVVILFLSLAVLGAFEASLASLGWVSWFNGLRWLRVHFINIGVLAEMVFGALPVLVAERTGRPQPPVRWDIWGLLTGGLVILLIGMPLINAALIVAGGSLILLAAILFIHQLVQMRRPMLSASLPFYLTGLAYLLIGAFLGMGIWLGWGSWLGLANVKEVHVHANLWGFLAPVFAGLLVDLYPALTGHPVAWVDRVWGIAALMALGALGLVVGPWVGVPALTSAGLIVHTLGTGWLLASAVRPLVGTGRLRTPGILHLITSYVWFLLPVVVAPLIVANAPNFPVAQVSSNGGPILIYGWALQFSLALIPLLAAKTLNNGESAPPQGSWLSLIGLHAGGVAYWLGLFLLDHQSWLHGLAFALWGIAVMPTAVILWRLIAVRAASVSMSAESLQW